MRHITAFFDYVTFPFFVVASMCATRALRIYGVPNLLITPIVVGAFIGLGLLLERFRPERPHEPRDISLVVEAVHFVFNFEFGYGAAQLVSALLERAFRLAFPAIWPTSWPVVLQLLVAVVLYESTSYWQHRLFHRRASLWPFHKLHHFGARLDFIRGARFHCVDFFGAALTAYFPLVLLGAPDDIVTMLAVLVAVLGIAHHGNFRERTPAWLDRLICTPAVHRRHHSLKLTEGDANFGNTVMLFDQLFGTYSKPHPIGPDAIGIDDAPLRKGFWAQFIDPFRESRSAGTPNG
jgi:ornithine lipid hydroxylase